MFEGVTVASAKELPATPMPMGGSQCIPLAEAGIRRILGNDFECHSIDGRQEFALFIGGIARGIFGTKPFDIAQQCLELGEE